MLGICRTRFCSTLPRLTKLSTHRVLSSYVVVPQFIMPLSFSKQISNHARQHANVQCQWRSYAHISAADMTQAKITERTMTVIKLFEKIKADKLTMESHFMKDLGLDSLDHVELLMAVEDEFGFEISDQDAEKLNKPTDVIKYLCEKMNVEYQ